MEQWILLCANSANSVTDWSTPAQIATIIYTGLTALLLGVAFIGINENNKLRNADFSQRIKKDFVTPYTLEIVDLISMGEIQYKSNGPTDSPNAFNIPVGVPYFEITNHAFENNFHNWPQRMSRLSPNFLLGREVCTHLIDHFEYIGLYEKKGIIDFEYVNEGYGDYISMAWNNTAIIEFIEDLRQGDGEWYSKFQYIANKINVHNNN